MTAQRFRATLERNGKGARIEVPFDPDDVWGTKERHLVGGSAGPCRLRASIDAVDGRHVITLGPAWLRDSTLSVGDEVDVVVEPEGPQRDDLAPDVAAALDASPAAGAFFDALAQFYRKGYLRWIDATKRSPELRAERIAEMVRLLEDGVKERPR